MGGICLRHARPTDSLIHLTRWSRSFRSWTTNLLSMKQYQSRKTHKPFLSIVACQHGDEPFGLNIINALRPRLEEFPGLQLIVANEEALLINKRGMEGDLNRSFPGDPNGHHEARLAYELHPMIKDSTYLLDIHTSVSACGFLVPIVTSLNQKTQRLLNLLEPSRIVCVEPPLSARSLIGSVQAGLSLEFQQQLTGTSAINVTIQLVENLYRNKKQPSKKRELFYVTDVLKNELSLPSTARDFELVEELGFYPILLIEPNTMASRGLKATRKVIRSL
jgi:hypothetical protein